MPNKLNDFFNNENITIMLREDLQHILTSFHNRGKSSLEYISDDLRKIHGAKPTDLRLLENLEPGTVLWDRNNLIFCFVFISAPFLLFALYTIYCKSNANLRAYVSI